MRWIIWPSHGIKYLDNAGHSSGKPGEAMADRVINLRPFGLPLVFREIGATGTFAIVTSAQPTGASSGGQSATVTAIPAATAETLLAALDASRTLLVILNDSTTGVLSVKYGQGVTAASRTTYLSPGQTLTVPGHEYTGPVYGVWSVADGTGAKVTVAK